MPLKFVLDENLRGPLWRTIQRHNARGSLPLDCTRVGDAEDLPLGTSDPAVLEWAEKADRIVITNDLTTMPGHLAAHLASGRHSPGVFSLLPHATFFAVLEFLTLAAYASDPDEWRDRIDYAG
jgi:hypothetical protein